MDTAVTLICLHSAWLANMQHAAATLAWPACVISNKLYSQVVQRWPSGRCADARRSANKRSSLDPVSPKPPLHFDFELFGFGNKQPTDSNPWMRSCYVFDYVFFYFWIFSSFHLRSERSETELACGHGRCPQLALSVCHFSQWQGHNLRSSKKLFCVVNSIYFFENKHFTKGA